MLTIPIGIVICMERKKHHVYRVNHGVVYFVLSLFRGTSHRFGQIRERFA